jgi:hypothetical protein
MPIARIKHAGVIAVISVTAAVGFSATASAHNLHVDPPGGGHGTHGTVGGAPLPEAAQGKGLIPAGPGGIFGLQSPAHDGGLVSACVALTNNGNSVVTILGPTGPGATPTCRHGSRPVG